MRARWHLVSLLGLGALACSGAAEPGETALVEARLTAIASCGDAEGAARAALLAWMNREIDRNLDEFLRTAGRDCSSSQEDVAYGAPSSSAPLVPPAASGTNNQVPGVEEADFVKNDSEYVYVASDGAFRIVDVWPASDAKEVAKVTLEGKPKKLLLLGDIVVVYASIETGQPAGGSPGYGGGEWGMPAPYPDYDTECTYGYDCDFVGDGNATRMSVYDVSDRTQPKLLRQLDLSGSLIAARSVGGRVHSVVYDDASSVAHGLELWADTEECGEFGALEGVVKYEALRAKNAQRILEAPVSELMPTLTDTLAGTSNLLGECAGFFASPLDDGTGFLTVLSFDPKSNDAPGTRTIVSRPGAVYATAESLYVAVRQQQGASNGWFVAAPDPSEATAIHEFSLTGPAPEYSASGLVPGFVLNQFALDEHAGHLRVASTLRRFSQNQASAVSVLDKQTLKTVGHVGGIGPGEDIRAVRFDAGRGYLVTFRSTDPLHVLDLSQAAAPKVTGELIVPGFSSYIHRLDDAHLLTIGFSAEWTDEVKLSLFDVADGKAPALDHDVAVGSFSGASSSAQTDHLAFTYYAPKKLLAVPVTECGGSFSGLVVYDVDTEAGFTLRGKVDHGSESNPYASDCWSSWTRSSSRVKRSIVFGEFIASISETRLLMSPLDSLGTPAASVSIGSPESEGAYW